MSAQQQAINSGPFAPVNLTPEELSALSAFVKSAQANAEGLIEIWANQWNLPPTSNQDRPRAISSREMTQLGRHLAARALLLLNAGYTLEMVSDSFSAAGLWPRSIGPRSR